MSYRPAEFAPWLILGDYNGVTQGKHAHAKPRFWPEATYTLETLWEEVAPNVYHTLFSVEGYGGVERLDYYAVIDAGKEVLFVDVGYWEVTGTDFLTQAVNRASGDWDDATVVVTHFHDDHAGNFHWALQQGAPTIYHVPRIPLDAQTYAAFVVESGWNDLLGPAAETPLELQTIFWDNDIAPAYSGEEVRTGDTFAIAGRILEVLETPGHCDDHLCLVDWDSGIVFGGDHLNAVGPTLMQMAPDRHLLRDYLATVDLLHNSDVSLLLSSHGDPLFGHDAIAERIDTIKSHLEKSAKKRLDAVAALGAATATQVAASLAGGEEAFSALPLRQRIRSVGNTWAFLEYLYETGELLRNGAPYEEHSREHSEASLSEDDQLSVDKSVEDTEGTASIDGENHQQGTSNSEDAGYQKVLQPYIYSVR